MTKTVLVCDDEDALRALVRATLDEPRYAIVEARDGDEAVALAGSARPDLVILDLMMPVRSGFDVLGVLRADPGLTGIPVLMLSARAGTADRDAALAAGADRYLTKPFSPLELVDVVEELLGVEPAPG